MNLKGRPTRSL